MRVGWGTALQVLSGVDLGVGIRLIRTRHIQLLARRSWFMVRRKPANQKGMEPHLPLPAGTVGLQVHPCSLQDVHLWLLGGPSASGMGSVLSPRPRSSRPSLLSRDGLNPMCGACTLCVFFCALYFVGSPYTC